MKAKHRKKRSGTSIRSEEDLEIVILRETHSALAEIIGPELYAMAVMTRPSSRLLPTMTPPGSPTALMIYSNKRNTLSEFGIDQTDILYQCQ